ncbi:hypothetical protein PR048_005556, partial [Dryococelus australis]
MKNVSNWKGKLDSKVSHQSGSIASFVFGDRRLSKSYEFQRGEDFWRKEMKPYLIKFYIDCVLPELVDTRHTRLMPIRDPECITRAQAKATTTNHIKVKMLKTMLNGKRRAKRLVGAGYRGLFSAWIHRKTPFKVSPNDTKFRGITIVPNTVPPGEEIRFCS